MTNSAFSTAGPVGPVGSPGVGVDWTPYTGVITATTTNPTPAADAEIQAYYSHVGHKLTISYRYWQTGVGVDGSGTYGFPIPPGLTIDTTAQPPKGSKGAMAVGGGSYWVTGYAGNPAVPYVLNATHIALSIDGGYELGSTRHPMGFSDRGYAFNVELVTVQSAGGVPMGTPGVLYDANPTAPNWMKRLGFNATGNPTLYVDPRAVSKLVQETDPAVRTAEYQTGPYTYAIGLYLYSNIASQNNWYAMDATPDRYTNRKIVHILGGINPGGEPGFRSVEWDCIARINSVFTLDVYSAAGLSPQGGYMIVETIVVDSSVGGDNGNATVAAIGLGVRGATGPAGAAGAANIGAVADANPSLAEQYKVLGFDATGALTKYTTVPRLIKKAAIEAADTGVYVTGPDTYAIAYYVTSASGRVPTLGSYATLDNTAGRFTGAKLLHAAGTMSLDSTDNKQSDKDSTIHINQTAGTVDVNCFASIFTAAVWGIEYYKP